MEGRCVQHACFIYNPDRRKYQGTEGKGMDAGICFLSGAFNRYHDLEICRDIFHTGISDIIDLTTFDLVVKTTEDADCWNGNKYSVPVLSDQYKKLGRAA